MPCVCLIIITWFFSLIRLKQANIALRLKERRKVGLVNSLIHSSNILKMFFKFLSCFRHCAFHREHSSDWAFALFSRATVASIFPNSTENFPALSYWYLGNIWPRWSFLSWNPVHLASKMSSILVSLLPYWLHLLSFFFSDSNVDWPHGSVLGLFLHPHFFPIAPWYQISSSMLLTPTFLSLVPTSHQSSRLVYQITFLTPSFWELGTQL